MNNKETEEQQQKEEQLKEYRERINWCAGFIRQLSKIFDSQACGGLGMTEFKGLNKYILTVQTPDLEQNLNQLTEKHDKILSNMVGIGNFYINSPYKLSTQGGELKTEIVKSGYFYTTKSHAEKNTMPFLKCLDTKALADLYREARMITPVVSDDKISIDRKFFVFWLTRYIVLEKVGVIMSDPQVKTMLLTYQHGIEKGIMSLYEGDEPDEQ